tara:strand:+ start:1661 stop:2644 length:984 start_codon:yes stop_codon:yes gene_type:complete
MATYKEIKGTQIEAVATDPSNPVEGQVWYNTTSNVLKGQAATTVGAWATGNNMNNSRAGFAAGLGIYTASIAAGGDNPAAVTTETWNGTNWTETNDLNTARYGASGSGSTTAGLVFGGVVNPSTVKGETESYNGTNWTEVNDLNTSRGNGAASFQGTSTASLMASGQTAPSTFLANTETFNGTNWTEVNDVNTARRLFGGSGTNPSGLIFGGSPSADTELWNGTNWTEVNNLNTARSQGTGTGASNTSALCFGGTGSPNVALTEEWNGTNWTEVADLNVGRNGLTGTGNATNGLAFGAESPSGSPSRQGTELWTGAGAGVTRTFTDS